MSVTFTAGTEDWNEEFQAIVCSTTSPEDGWVNMSNSNAHNVCQALGIDLEPEWCGSMSADDFLGRVLLALAISPEDEGMPSYELPREPGRVRWIEAARRPGYLQERLGQLRELADWAVANEAIVMWA